MKWICSATLIVLALWHVTEGDMECKDFKMPVVIQGLHGKPWYSCPCRALKNACTREYQPVCDDSHNEYSNSCLMCAAAGEKRKKGEKIPRFAGEPNELGEC